MAVEDAIKFVQTNSFRDIIFEAGLTEDELEQVLRTLPGMNQICFDLLQQGYNFEQVFALTESQKNMLHDKIPLEFVLEHNTLFYMSGTIPALRFQGKDEASTVQLLHKLAQVAKPNPSLLQTTRQDKNELSADILEFLRSPRGQMYVNDGTFSLDEVCTQLTAPEVQLLLTDQRVHALVTKVGVLPRELNEGWIALLETKPKPSTAVKSVAVDEQKRQSEGEGLGAILLSFSNSMKALKALRTFVPANRVTNSAVATLPVSAPLLEPDAAAVNTAPAPADSTPATKPTAGLPNGNTA